MSYVMLILARIFPTVTTFWRVFQILQPAVLQYASYLNREGNKKRRYGYYNKENLMLAVEEVKQKN